MEFVDTHCHIQFAEYPMDPEEALSNAHSDGVTKVIAVGCTLEDSKAAVEFASKHENVWAAIGLHPHEAKQYVDDDKALESFRELANKPEVVAIGETGLDYFYEHSNREDQKKLLRFQLDLATEHNLPVIFHVRESFKDFWEIFDKYKNIRGVVHSFSSGYDDLEQVLVHGLYVGLNGIMTFSKKAEQLGAAKQVPLSSLLLETDAPFLTPVPFRGKIGEPKYVRVTAEFLAGLRGESINEIADVTTKNAHILFKLA